MSLKNVILEQRIKNWAEAYSRNGYLHGSILVAANGNILLNKGYGMANWEHQVPNMPSTKFRVGSITKGFTAMAIFQLHEGKMLDVHDPVGKYLSGYPNGNSISIYHCLTNTSGIPDFTSFPDFWSRTMRLPHTLKDIIDSFKDKELDFEPGVHYSYSTSGYMLLTAIIEVITGKTYADYMREHIFLPLGMYDTGCDDGRKIVPGLAAGYSFWETPIHTEFADLSFPLGGYGLYSTTEDLFRWDQALHKSQLISKTLTEKMFTPYLDSYACGWAISSISGRKCANHFGDISGFSNDFLRFADDRVSIIFLSNMNITPVIKLTRDIAKVIFDEPVSLPDPLIPVDFSTPEVICGTYTHEKESGISLEIMTKNNDLYVVVPKMYGAVYKFRLIPIKHTAGKLTCMTEMIDETLIINYSGDKAMHAEYTDYHGNFHMLYKRI